MIEDTDLDAANITRSNLEHTFNFSKMGIASSTYKAFDSKI